MSEVRETTTIEEIDAPASEPLISLTQVLAAVGWLAYQGTRVAVKGAIAGSVLAYKGGRAIAAAVKEQRKQACMSEIARAVGSSRIAQEAVAKLSLMSGLEISQNEAPLFTARLQTLVANNDKRGIGTMARELVIARQTRIQSQLLPIVVESCRAIGFEPQPLDVRHGIIVAKGKGRQTITIEIARAKDGDVRLHFDSDGFEGGACAYAALDPLQDQLRARGVRFELTKRARKHQRPVFDRSRMNQPRHIRLSR
jgi:hypothetical protein